MKKTLSFILLFSFSVIFAQVYKNVFFVGNSYTYSNDLPNLISQIATSTGDVLTFQSHTPGGATFSQHSSNQNVISTINLGNWDYVVLQEQSQLPSFPDHQVQTQSFPYARQLATMINDNNTCGNVIFFMTWGHKFGDQGNCPNISYLCTYEGMDDKIYARYMQMANNNKALVSPVGKVWRTLRTQNPDLELYIPDNSHPSYLGSMAAAYTFYTVIFKKDPTLAPFIGNLSVNEANIIRNTVKNVVFDHMDTWLITSNDVHSQFSSTFINPQTVQFNNQTQSATSFLWNFGDGTTSTLENPLHIYNNIGNYTVSLTTNACESNTTRTETIAINSLSTHETEVNDIIIFPNPVKDILNIKTNKDLNKIELLDASGRLINISTQKNNDGYSIPTYHLKKGMYLLKYNFKGQDYSHKIQKN